MAAADMPVEEYQKTFIGGTATVLQSPGACVRWHHGEFCQVLVEGEKYL